MKTMIRLWKRWRLRKAAEALAQAKAEVAALSHMPRSTWYCDRWIAANGRVGKYEERVEQLMRQ